MRTPTWIIRLKEPKKTASEYIPIYSPLISGNEQKYVDRCLKQNWLSSKGDYVNKFERAFAKYCNSDYAVSCSSGTAALFLALKSLHVAQNDEVIIPTFTMISTAFAVTYTGATPVFIDCKPDDGNLDLDQIEKSITKRTKAIIPVYVYGNPYNYYRLKEIANKYHLKIIDDAAEALGSEYDTKKVGSLTDLSAFSLYANKLVTTGEGGMITTNSKKYHEYIKFINNYSFSSVRHFWHTEIGYNYRMSNLQAAVGLAQLETVEERITKKIMIAKWYEEFLSVIKNKIIPLSVYDKGKSNYWHIAYKIIDEKFHIQQLRNVLGRNGIETRGLFIPIHLQPSYWKKEYNKMFPNSENLCKTGILLPSGPELSKKKIEYICKIIRKYFNA